MSNELNEKWVEMWEFPHYEISNLGNVRHIKRPEKNLAVRQDGREYRMVCIWGNGKKYNKRIGRYVWMSFNQCGCALTIDHINGNAGDDRLENLQCISNKENNAKRTDRSGKQTNKYHLSKRDKGYIHKSIVVDKTETTWTIMKKYGVPLNYLQTTIKRGSWAKYMDLV